MQMVTLHFHVIFTQIKYITIREISWAFIHSSSRITSAPLKQNIIHLHVNTLTDWWIHGHPKLRMLMILSGHFL